MHDWCRMNCFAPTSYCPETHCDTVKCLTSTKTEVKKKCTPSPPTASQANESKKKLYLAQNMRREKSMGAQNLGLKKG